MIRIPALLLVAVAVVAADPEAIPLAGTWEVARTQPVQRPYHANSELPDPGASTAAKALLRGETVEGVTWEEFPLPQPWNSAPAPWPDTDGEVVFRRTVVVPDPGPGAWELRLGAIDDFDTATVNGVEVGSTDKRTPGFWAVRRIYPVPAGVLKAGENRIVVRMFDQVGNGGFTAKPKDVVLKPVK